MRKVALPAVFARGWRRARLLWRRRSLTALSTTGLAAIALGIVGASALTSDQPASKTAVAPVKTSAVLADDGWLSESYWRKKRLKRAARRSRRSNLDYLPPDSNPFGLLGSSGAGSGGNGTYRTVCVRLCDGYYFPISFSTTRSRFGADAQACSSRCSGSPARLFVYPNGSGSPETMKDVRGRPYADLPNAFLYRTSYSKSCQCRPDPWSPQAKQLHAMYATKGWQKKARRIARAEARKARRQSRLARRIAARFRQLPRATEDDPDSPATVAGFAVPGVNADLRPSVNFSRSRRMGLGRQVSRRERRRPRVIRRSRRQAWRKNAFSSSSDR